MQKPMSPPASHSLAARLPANHAVLEQRRSTPIAALLTIVGASRYGLVACFAFVHLLVAGLTRTALAGKALALLSSRYHVAMDDVRAVALPSLNHRIIRNFHGEMEHV